MKSLVKFTQMSRQGIMPNCTFRRFLVEMETTPDEKDRLRTIIRKLINGDRQWLKAQEIGFGDKGQFWIVNYNQGPRNDYNRLVRGMVVRKAPHGWKGDELELIASFPFTRFFNRGEGEAAPVDFANAAMLEKLDGSMVGVFFPHGDPHKPEFHTRRMLSTHTPDMDLMIGGFHGAQFPFMKIIGGYVKQLKFDGRDVVMTYVFEFVHEASKVLTQYPAERYGLHLLGARNILTHKELTEEELDQVAQRIGSMRPRRWTTSGDSAEIHRILDDMAVDTPDFEGAVFRDTEGRRVKLKRDDYVKLHHMLDKLSYKYLIPAILAGEAEEILAHFPQAQERVDEFNDKYQKFIDHVVNRIKYWRTKDMPKQELAQVLRGRPAKRWDAKEGGPTPKIPPAEPNGWVGSKILSYLDRDEQDIREKLDQELRSLGTGKNEKDNKANFNPGKLMELIGLEDDDVEEEL